MSNDRSYLSSLQDYYARHHALPSYASIGGLLGLRSKSSVAALVARLKLAGFVESTPDRRLAPTGRFCARPLHSASREQGLLSDPSRGRAGNFRRDGGIGAQDGLNSGYITRATSTRQS